MERVSIIEYLLNNTEECVRRKSVNISAYEVYLLAAVGSESFGGNPDAVRLSYVIDAISQDGYDVSNYCLFNSSQDGCFTFCRLEGRGGAFDITYYSKNDVEISYMDDDYCDHVCDSIAVAAANYTNYY